MSRLLLLAVAGTSLSLLPGCFTGVESTKRIALNRKEIRHSEPTAEEKFIAEVKSLPLSQWKEGKRFYVSDPKFSLLLIQRSLPADTALHPRRGDVLTFTGTVPEQRPDGSVTTAIGLRGRGVEYLYDTGLTPEIAGMDFNSFDIQTLIDLDALEMTAKKLTGNTYWTRTDLWYDDADNVLRGNKYVAVKVDSVSPGSMIFPVRINFTDHRGVHAHYYMSLEGSPGASSRRFHQLFALDDVKKRYPKIEADVWELIQQGKVRVGMTKEECRLSFGPPKDSDSGRSYSSTLDVWIYDGGRYLKFEDGLLVNFRQ